MAALNGLLVYASWHLRTGANAWLRRFGVVGVVLVVLGALAGIALLARHQMQQRWHEINRGETLRLAIPNAQSTTRSVESETMQALARFESRLPDHLEVPQSVADLFEIAGKQQLVLTRGEYKWQSDEAGGFQRYQMSLPVRGEPEAIQTFIREALIAFPTLSFEAVQFKRDRVDTRAVEARIQWSLLVRTRKPAGVSAPVTVPVRSPAGVSS